MTEAKIFNKLLHELNGQVNFYNVETGATVLGVPDIFYSMENYINKSGWIELKRIPGFIHKLYDPITIPYRPGQRKWLIKQRKLGLNIFVLIYINKYYYLLTNFSKTFGSFYELSNVCIWKGRHFYKKEFINKLRGR